MNQLAYEKQTTSSTKDSDYIEWRWYVSLPILVFAIELLYPQLVVLHILPDSVRWISDAAIAAMIVIVVLRMLMLDRLPIALLLVIAATVLGAIVALLGNQGFGTTLYGWWRLFMYPLVGLYAYMMPAWPPWFAKWLMRICLIILGFEVVFQFIQFSLGMVEHADHIAGTLGHYGVGPLVLFIFLVLAFGLGKWLSNGDWHYLVIALTLGAMSSSLGEMKLYPVAVLAMTGLAILIQLVRGRQLHRIVTILVILALAVVVFISLFNLTFAATQGQRIQDYFSSNALNDYLVGSRLESSGQFSLSRNTEPLYYWKKNQSDPASILFGSGIGSSGRSEALGFSGVSRQSSFYLAGSGRSLSMFIREGGVVGLITLASFFIITVIVLYRNADRNAGTDMAAVQYALLLFTALWPLWMWYLASWVLAMPMLLYWISLGFALNPENRSQVA